MLDHNSQKVDSAATDRGLGHHFPTVRHYYTDW